MKMPMFVILITFGILGVPREAFAQQQPNPYQPLGGTGGIEDQINQLANGSGGDATRFKLTDASGSEITTDGIAGVDDAGGHTLRNMWLLKITKGGGGTGRANILVTGTHHAREHVAYVVTLNAGEYLLAHKSDEVWLAGDTRFDHFRLFKEMNVKLLTDNANILLIPVTNPQGYQYSREIANSGQGDPLNQSDGWRTNRRDTTSDPIPSGAVPPAGSVFIGVDPNRNYPAQNWGTVTYVTGFPQTDATERTSRKKWKDVYCGLPDNKDASGNYTWVGAAADPAFGPVVEKETGGVVALSNANPISCHIDVHAYGGEVGWAENVAATANIRQNGGFSDKDLMKILGAKSAMLIADPAGGTYSPKESPYPTSGDVLQWQYERSGKKALAFLIEVGPNFRPSDPKAHADAVLPGMLFMMFATVDKSFSSKPSASFRKP